MTLGVLIMKPIDVVQASYLLHVVQLDLCITAESYASLNARESSRKYWNLLELNGISTYTVCVDHTYLLMYLTRWLAVLSC